MIHSRKFNSKIQVLFLISKFNLGDLIKKLGKRCLAENGSEKKREKRRYNLNTCFGIQIF